LDLSDNLIEINSCDLLVIAGGPVYSHNVYPVQIPFVKNLSDIKVPIFAMGLGWYASGHQSIRYDYDFSKSTLSLLKRIENDGYPLGCRDFNSVCVLKKAGILNTKLTGCAAYFDIGKLTNVVPYSGGGKGILISDPALAANYNLSIELCKYLRKKFPNKEITFVFHRGTFADKYTYISAAKRLQKLLQQLDNIGIKYSDIAYGVDGFNMYDNCDLHIGFRVHAHIYALSQKRPSILIEEDLRGDGANDLLGLMHIKADRPIFDLIRNRYLRKIYKSNLLFAASNATSLKYVNSLLEYYQEAGFEQFEWVNKRIEYYFNQMIGHLKSIKTI
jgi:hypothetical protein